MKSEAAQQHREASPETPETPKGGATTVGAILEHARSSRSTCRVCSNAIGKGQLRVGRACILQPASNVLTPAVSFQSTCR